MNDVKLTVIIPVYNQETLVIKAIDSIPNHNFIEVIVIDDGSSDNTWDNLCKYKDLHSDRNILLFQNDANMGVSYTVNKGYDNAHGEYVVLLGSDDYFITTQFEKALKYLDGTDLIYFNLRTNNGSIIKLSPKTKVGYCGSTKFMKREFIGDTRCPCDKKAGEDWFFYQELLKKNPTEKFTDLTIKHYNYPRKDSLSDLVKQGKIRL